jgi:hypothetical protein
MTDVSENQEGSVKGVESNVSSTYFSLEVESRVGQDDGISLVWRHFVVVKLSSKTTWNWGLTSPVEVLKMRGMEEA